MNATARSLTRRLAAAGALLALLAPLCAPAGAAGPVPLAALQAQVDSQVRAGYERPQPALAALEALDASLDPDDTRSEALAARRSVLLGRGRLLANAERGAEARHTAEALDTLAFELRTRRADGAAAVQAALAQADASLVRAAAAHVDGQVDDADGAAELALRGYTQACARHDACEARSSWEALMIRARQSDNRGDAAASREHALAAVLMARKAQDTDREVVALAVVALRSQKLGDATEAQQAIARARRLAQLDGSPWVQPLLKLLESGLRQARGDREGARQAVLDGLAMSAERPRMQASLLVNLSDIEVKSGRPQAALRAVARALPVARERGDRRTVTVLLHNAALAHVALGQSAQALRTLDDLLAAHAQRGASGKVAQALREFSDAFAAAGEWHTALALYHRERQLSTEIMEANRESALAALRTRFDAGAQQRQLEQLARESTLTSAKLANRATLQKVWAAGALAVVLAIALVALMYRRVREVHKKLAHNHAFLRAQSQRDPLTGLANRRALQDHPALAVAGAPFSGALLLVDIDHFKHVNDGHGHAAGDAVLVEVARRLAACVDGELVVRWGGEEFLIFLPAGDAAAAAELAARLLQAVGGTPVALADKSLPVTVSIGFAAFALPPSRWPLGLERAINLVDMALYTAKNQGRNRGVGIVVVDAPDAVSMQRIESDFEQAWQDGRVSLRTLPGPSAEAAGPSDDAPPAVRRPSVVEAERAANDERSTDPQTA